MDQDLLVTEQHPKSKRWAILEDDGMSCWLYLSAPDDFDELTGDAWIYNRISPPTATEVSKYRDKPPPAGVGYASGEALRETPNAEDVRFAWSEDGESVAVLIDYELMGFLAKGHRKGFSRFLLRAGPWGRPLDTGIYRKIFFY